MTGTLITNKELDVFSQYRFVNPNIFGTSFYRFRNTFFEMKGYGNHIPVFKKALTDTFLKRMHCIAFRTTKAECLDLPDITEEVRQVELEPKAMHVYRELEKESITQLKNSEVSAVWRACHGNSQCKHTRKFLQGADGRERRRAA